MMIRTLRAKRHLGGALLLVASALIAVVAVPLTSAQSTNGEDGEEHVLATMRVPLSEPRAPVTLKVNLQNGSMSVEGGDVDEVVVEVLGKKPAAGSKQGGSGMRRISTPGGELSADEIDNVVAIRRNSNRYTKLRIITPRRTSTVLKMTNGGGLYVQGLTGDHELKNVNGGIQATEMSGSVVAESSNGGVVVEFDDIDPDKAMAFQSWNGRVDVTFPDDLNANLRLDTAQGEIYSDFGVEIDTAPVMPESRDKKGRYKIKMSSEVRGKAGRGGPLLRFKSYNGNIYLRKGE